MGEQAGVVCGTAVAAAADTDAASVRAKIRRAASVLCNSTATS